MDGLPQTYRKLPSSNVWQIWGRMMLFLVGRSQRLRTQMYAYRADAGASGSKPAAVFRLRMVMVSVAVAFLKFTSEALRQTTPLV